MRRFVLLAAVLCLAGTAAFAQDCVKVDPNHYKLISENARVRVLRIHYGPHEKSVMHSHPDSVVTFLSDARVKFTMPDGTTREQTIKAGDAMFTPAETHLPENLGDTAMDGVLVELKSRPAVHTAPAPPHKQGS